MAKKIDTNVRGDDKYNPETMLSEDEQKKIKKLEKKSDKTKKE